MLIACWILSLTTIINSSPYNKGYTHGLIVQADNQDAIDRYRASKLRELTVPLFGEWVEDATSVDLSNPK